MTLSRRNTLSGAAGLLSAAAVRSAKAQPQDIPIRIGVLNDMSGPYADITRQSSLLAVQMAVSDGRVERDMYLFRVRTPGQSKSEWDLQNLVSTVPFKDAFRPLAEGGCAYQPAQVMITRSATAAARQIRRADLPRRYRRDPCSDR